MAEGTLMTYAYTGDLLLPLTVTPGQRRVPRPCRRMRKWLVCKDICVPEEGDFRLDLPAGIAAPSAQAPLFAAPDRQVPRPSPWQAAVAGDGTLLVQGPELTHDHGGRCLVHSRCARGHPRQRGAAADGVARRLHPGIEARQGVPAGRRSVGDPDGARPQRAGDRRRVARRSRRGAAADRRRCGCSACWAWRSWAG